MSALLNNLTTQQRSQYESLASQSMESAQKYLKLVNNPVYAQHTTQKAISVDLSDFEIREGIDEAIAQLNDLRQAGRSTRMRERKILLWLQKTQCHKQKGHEYPSFQQFLIANFSVSEARVYCKQLVIATKELILGLPVGSYSQWEFLPLERFKVMATKGQNGRAGKPWNAGDRVYGTKIEEEQKRRLKECWARACELADSERPERKYILAAAKEASAKYNLKVKDRESITYWKRRAIAAEKELEALKKSENT